MKLWQDRTTRFGLCAALIALAILATGKCAFAQEPVKACMTYDAAKIEAENWATLMNSRVVEISDQGEIDRYLAVINAAPPETNMQGERLLLFRALQFGRIQVIGIFAVRNGMVCENDQSSAGLELHGLAWKAARPILPGQDI